MVHQVKTWTSATWALTWSPSARTSPTASTSLLPAPPLCGSSTPSASKLRCFSSSGFESALFSSSLKVSLAYPAGTVSCRLHSPFSLRKRTDNIVSAGYSNTISEEEFGNALYVIDIGQNDLFMEFIDQSYEQVNESIPTFIAVIESAMRVNPKLFAFRLEADSNISIG